MSATPTFAPADASATAPAGAIGTVPTTVAQALILADWRGMKSKNDFQEMQRSAPTLIAMGMDDQRREAVRAVG